VSPQVDPFPSELEGLVARAFSRTRDRLREGAPTLSAHVSRWVRSLSHHAPPESYFTHPQAFPMLLLPWWLEAKIATKVDRTFQEDLVYSTVNGYYFVRMVDDLMDREHVADSTVLPALIFFHMEFQLTYQRHFPGDHLFWDAFAMESFAAAEAASSDAGLDQIDRETFVRICAKKIAGVRVPLAAVCFRYERPDLVEPWNRFMDAFGCWHQMQNDVFGWSRDLAHDRRTYFLSEASRRRGNASTAAWAISDGLAWAYEQLQTWMSEVRIRARDLECPPLSAYIEQRNQTLATEWHGLAKNLAVLEQAAGALR
jgi:hypothetical protein